MGRSRLTDDNAGFSGGINANGLYEPVDETMFATCTNMRLVRNMEMAKRPGAKSLSTLGTNPGIAFLRSWFPSGAAPQLVYMAWNAGSGLYSFYKATFDATTGAITATRIAAADGWALTGVSAAQFRDGTGEVLYGAIDSQTSNTNTKLWKFDGTTVTLNIGTPVKILNIWVYNQRLFGCTRTDQTIYWSGLNNGDTLGDTANGGGSATVRTYGSSSILGGCAIGNTNYLIHERGISKFVGRTFDDIAIQAGTEGVAPHYEPLTSAGSWEPGMPLVVDGIGYLPTYQGLLLMSEQEVRPYQTPEFPDQILAYVRSNPRVVCGAVVENVRSNEIWFTLYATEFDTSFRSTRTFIYNKQLQRFTGTADFISTLLTIGSSGVVASGSRVIGQFIPQVFIWANVPDGKLFGVDFATTDLEVYQDNASNYTSSVQCRRMFTAQPQSTKSWRQIFTQMGGGGAAGLSAGTATGATISYSTSVGGTVTDSTSLKALETNNTPIGGQGQYIDVTITDGGNVSTDWSVQRVDVSGFDMGLRGN